MLPCGTPTLLPASDTTVRMVIKVTVIETTPDPKLGVDNWRWNQALRMGCEPRLADLVVRHPEVDLHELEQLIARDCPPDVAFDILRG